MDPLTTKNIHILEACEVENHRDQILNLSMLSTSGNSRVATNTATLDKMMNAGIDKGLIHYGIEVLDNAWRTAAAHHYFSLAHQQLYNGNPDRATKTAICCTLFEDNLHTFHIYSSLALAAYESRYFDVCSRTFTKLETLKQNVDNIMVESIQKLVRSFMCAFYLCVVCTLLNPLSFFTANILKAIYIHSSIPN